MKKYLLGVALLICGMISSVSLVSAAYKQQGFSQFSEKDGTISFRCEKSCAVLLGNVGENDSVVVKSGTAQGDGMRGYGYVVGQNVYAATIVPVSNYERTFSDDPIYKQLPAGDKQVVFLVSGPLKADGVSVSMRQRSASEKLGRTWKRFWNTENVAPYSINLHYGPMVGGWSWPLFGLVVMIIAVVITMIVRKKTSLNNFFHLIALTLIIITIFGGIRLLVDDFNIVGDNKAHYTDKPAGQKTVFDLGSYITVTDQVRQYLALDNVSVWKDKKCSIDAKTNMDWPYTAHRASVYLRPCEIVQTGSMADYQLYYNAPIQGASGNIVLTGDNFILFHVSP